MSKSKKADRMMTEAKVLTMIGRIVEMWAKSLPGDCLGDRTVTWGWNRSWADGDAD